MEKESDEYDKIDITEMPDLEEGEESTIEGQGLKILMLKKLI